MNWIVAIIGLFPIGLGMIGVFLPMQVYIIDVYNSYSASALAAVTVVRSIIAAFLPLAGPALFEDVGLG